MSFTFKFKMDETESTISLEESTTYSERSSIFDITNIALQPELSQKAQVEKWILEQNFEHTTEQTSEHTTEQTSEHTTEQKVSVPDSLKKEPIEVSKLKSQIKQYESQMYHLRHNLRKAETNLKGAESQRAYEKALSTQKIENLGKQFLEIQKKYNSEKLLRKQKEKELHRFQEKETQNKKLYTMVDQMERDLNIAKKTIEEQKKQLYNKDLKIQDTTNELTTAKKLTEKYKEKVARVKYYIEKSESSHKEVQKQESEIAILKKQVDADEKKVSHLEEEISTLKEKMRELSFSHLVMENKLAKTQGEKTALKKDLEKVTNEADNHQDTILALKEEICTINGLKLKFQSQYKQEHAQTLKNEGDILYLRSALDELEKKNIVLTAKTETAIKERDHHVHDLHKAHERIIEKDKTIKELNTTVQCLQDELNKKTTQLSITTRQCQSAKAQLQPLGEAIEIQEKCLIFSDNEKNVIEKQMAKVEAEKNRLEKDLVHFKDLVKQQQKKIDLLTDINLNKDRQEDQIKSLHLANKNLTHKCLYNHMKLKWIIKRTHRRGGFMCKAQTCSYRHFFVRRYFHQHQYQLNLEEKDKEIKDLKQMLARRPADAIEMLQKCQLHNRDLSKQLMASQGLCKEYEEKYKSLNEENKTMKDDLRKLKLENGHLSKHSILPSISRKSQSSSEIKSVDQSDSSHISRNRYVPSISTKSQCQPMHKSNAVPLAPIHCKEKQMSPPPPSH